MIPFPKIHIATSVLNRIMNTLEEAGPLGMSDKKAAPVEITPPMIAPDPNMLGTEIDSKLREPVAPVAVPPENETDAESGMLNASVMGGSPLDGALLGVGS